MTNQRVEAAQGDRIAITCRGVPGSNPTWKKRTGNTSTGLPVEVTQTKSSLVAILHINLLNSAKTGVYACHYGVSSIETVIVGEFT